MPDPTPQSPPAGKVPVSERIAQNIVATLQTITIANGYSFDACVSRPNPGVGDSLKDGRILVVCGEATKEEDAPQLNTQWRQTYYIAGECLQSERDVDVTIDQRRNYMRASMEWALTYDSNLSSRENQTRGALAEDTIVKDPIVPPLPPNAHEGQIIVVVEVVYRTKYNDPFTSIYDS